MSILKKIKPEYMIAAVYIFIAAYISFAMSPFTRDDVVLSKAVQDLRLPELWDYIVGAYKGASSRFVINAVWFSLLKLPRFVFSTINLCMFAILSFSLWKMTVDGTQENKRIHMLASVLSLILIYSFEHMASAGWYATVISYFWPVALGIYALIPIKKVYNSGKFNWYEYITFPLAVIFATSCEQICVGLTFAYTLFVLYEIFNKRFNVFNFTILVLCIANLLVSLLNPGNKLRLFSDSALYMPDFLTLSIINKLVIGFYTTMNYLLIEGNMIFLIFSFFLCFAVFLKHKNLLFRFISIVPLAFGLLFGLFNNISAQLFPSVNALFSNELSRDILISGQVYTNRTPVLTIYSLLFFIILITIYLIYENTLSTITVCLIFGTGIVLRMIPAFAPSIYASRERTFISAYFSLIICSLFVYRKIIEIDGYERYRNITLGLCGAALLSFVNLLPVL